MFMIEGSKKSSIQTAQVQQDQPQLATCTKTRESRGLCCNLMEAITRHIAICTGQQWTSYWPTKTPPTASSGPLLTMRDRSGTSSIIRARLKTTSNMEALQTS